MVHVIADDLGIPRDYTYSAKGAPPKQLKTWLDVEDALILCGLGERLGAEWLMDVEDAARDAC